jgi:hypothetical protein
MYMRLLDCYSEYLFSRQNIDSPNLQRKRVKVFDVVTVQEAVNDHLINKGNDMKIDNELIGFFDYDIVILPFFISEINFKRC